MKLTEEQLKENDNIPTEEILADIKDTQKEIDIYRGELEIFRKNPVENKVAIFFREGRISQRETFIDKLNQILEYRKRL